MRIFSYAKKSNETNDEDKRNKRKTEKSFFSFYYKYFIQIKVLLLSKLQFSQWISGFSLPSRVERLQGLQNCLFWWRPEKCLLRRAKFNGKPVSIQFLCAVFFSARKCILFSHSCARWNIHIFICFERKCVIKFNAFKSAITIRLFLLFSPHFNVNTESINFENISNIFHQVVKTY